jgi:hypothetical protein
VSDLGNALLTHQRGKQHPPSIVAIREPVSKEDILIKYSKTVEHITLLHQIRTQNQTRTSFSCRGDQQPNMELLRPFFTTAGPWGVLSASLQQLRWAWLTIA